MARYTDAVCRQCRREGQKLFLKGDRCYTQKCAMENRAYPPGQHGQGRSKTSEYGQQMREKQKAKRYYGLLESQFRSYFDMAERRPGQTGENLLAICESRLDNVVYRLGIAPTRAAARQLVSHCHICVNGSVVNIPSYSLRAGDVVSVREKSKSLEVISASLAGSSKSRYAWLEWDNASMSGRFLQKPEREEIPENIKEQLIVELYSK